MKKILVGLVIAAGLALLASQASAGCSYNTSNSSSNNGYNFLEIIGGKITVYEERVMLNVDIKFARRSYQGCKNNFKSLKKNTTIKVSCQLGQYNDITLQGKLADDMDAYSYEGMVIGKIYNQSVINDMTDFLNDGSSRMRCTVLGNDTMLKLKVVDKRDL